MNALLHKPTGLSGKVHDITPEVAGWRYVGFGLYRLAAGEKASEPTGDREAILVVIEGKAKLSAAGTDFAEMGDRMSVFEKRRLIVFMFRGTRNGAQRRPRTASSASVPPLASRATRRKGSGRRASS